MKKGQLAMLRQIDAKIAKFDGLPEVPKDGWILTVRSSLGMSLRQFSARLGINISSAREIEQREQNETISIRSLGDAARALNMKLVYGLAPIDATLDEMIAAAATKVARRIIERTSTTMAIEDQRVSDATREAAIAELAREIKREMPRYLWD